MTNDELRAYKLRPDFGLDADITFRCIVDPPPPMRKLGKQARAMIKAMGKQYGKMNEGIRDIEKMRFPLEHPTRLSYYKAAQQLVRAIRAAVRAALEIKEET